MNSLNDTADSRWLPIVRTLVFVVFAVLLAALAILHSPVSDEVAQLPAGVYHIEQGRFDLARANPPLVRLVAAIPVVIAGYHSNWSRVDPGPGKRSEFPVGKDFVEANGERTFFLFTLGRLACIPLVLVGGVVCWKWASELYGPGAGLVALILWSFCPNVLANGALMTPDAVCASLGALAGYSFWRWLCIPTWQRTIFAGLALGAAEAAKCNWLILFALWPFLYCFWWATSEQLLSAKVQLRQVLQLATILGIAVIIINAIYGFDQVGVQLKTYDFTSKPFQGNQIDSASRGPATGNRFRSMLLGELPVPLPKQFVIGVDTQLTAFEAGRPAYLFGKWKYGGWWYYYFVAMLFKIPFGGWLLGGIVAGLRVRKPTTTTKWRDEVILLAPAVATLLFISLQGGVNRHFRYVLPALPFFYIWFGSATALIFARPIFPRIAVLGACAWFALSSLLVFPHCNTYFNELCGGPQGGSRVLLGSNVSWGQDLLFLRRWVDMHPQSRPLFISLYTPVRPQLAGIDHPPIPKTPSPGWYVVGLTTLLSDDSDCAYLKAFKPVDRVAYSMHVYHLTEVDILEWKKAQARKQVVVE